MDKAKLERILQQALKDVHSYNLEENINKDSYLATHIINSRVEAPNEQIQFIANCLKKEYELKLFDGGWIIYGDSGMKVDLNDLAHWLLAQSLKTSPLNALDKLERFLSKDNINLIEILAISGINVERSINIIDDIKLIPFSHVPRSIEKDDLEGIQSFIPGKSYQFYRQFGISKPTAALIVATEQKKRMVHSIPKPLSSLVDSKIDKLIQVCKCLTLIGPSSPIPVAHWYYAEEIPIIEGTGYSIIPSEIESSQSKTVSSESVGDLLRLYFTLSKDTQRRLDIPLGRLNLAIRRKDPIDKAIELGIALESLLTADRDSDAPLSYLLRLRGALLGGDSIGERKQYYDILKKVYRLRSSAVHSGSLRDKDDIKILEKGEEVCSKLIQNIIRKGSIPDWEDMILKF